MFSNARSDSQWGKLAIFAMVELYLDVHCEMRGVEANNARDISNEDVNTIHQLLNEVRSFAGDSVKLFVLECYTTMSTRQKDGIDSCICKLQAAALKQMDSVPILNALATGFMFLGETVKAKNALKNIDRISYNWEEGDDFEYSWLLLSNIYSQESRDDMVEKYCKKILNYKKNCSKAWEFLGLVAERNQDYTKAVFYYEQALSSRNERVTSVNYRLAVCYLMVRRYIDAILMCHTILNVVPEDHLKIRKDILDKARWSLRP